MIPRLTDDGTFLELRPQYGPSLITALARIGGRSVGIIASNPYFFAGSIDAAGCDKAIHFTCLCEAFNIPMVYLQDVPGFLSVVKQNAPESSRRSSAGFRHWL